MGNIDFGTGFTQESINRIGFNIGEDAYFGEHAPGSDHFFVTNKKGEKILVMVRDISDEFDESEEFAEREYRENYPHLQMRVGMFRNITKEYSCYALKIGEKHESLENVIFHRNMSLPNRLILSLSLAAAFSELEAVFEDIPVKHISLDAFWVDTEKYEVTVDCSKLCTNCSESDNNEVYGVMSELGLMPPEFYCDSEIKQITVQMLRHILAVCIFRIMCAEDPFDGDYTLFGYPYKGKTALKQIYGSNAQYILNKNTVNRVNSYIGTRAYSIFALICPRLKAMFDACFINGIVNPSERPSSRAWVDNQMQMVAWFTVVGKEWRIADLISGNGTFEGQMYLVIEENGMIIPLINDKPIYQFMFDASDMPVNESKIGFVRVNKTRIELVLDKAKNNVFALSMTGKNKIAENMHGIVIDKPWKNNLEGLNR